MEFLPTRFLQTGSGQRWGPEQAAESFQEQPGKRHWKFTCSRFATVLLLELNSADSLVCVQGGHLTVCKRGLSPMRRITGDNLMSSRRQAREGVQTCLKGCWCQRTWFR